MEFVLFVLFNNFGFLTTRGDLSDERMSNLPVQFSQSRRTRDHTSLSRSMVPRPEGSRWLSCTLGNWVASSSPLTTLGAAVQLDYPARHRCIQDCRGGSGRGSLGGGGGSRHCSTRR
jgi:hypothetical protein